MSNKEKEIKYDGFIVTNRAATVESAQENRRHIKLLLANDEPFKKTIRELEKM